jgi:GNAT superfamily N-acetyltransferase
MPSIEVRPFRRSDRDQLTRLVNAHVAAVIPGVSVSVNAVMSQLEREPGEFIVDPWVIERATLVAEQRGRIVAAAHMLRYADEERVSESYRGAGEIRWFGFWPDAPYWPDASQAASVLVGACIEQFIAWGTRRQYADGTLPAPGVYGLPEQWPHVRDVYEQAGFVHEGRTEIVFLACVEELSQPDHPPLPGVVLKRSVGINGTRLSAMIADQPIGFIEVGMLDDAGRAQRAARWADIGNLHVVAQYRRRRVGTWLVGQAGDWLRLAGVDRVLAYEQTDHEDQRAFLLAVGYRELTRTSCGWRLAHDRAATGPPPLPGVS